MLLPVFPACLGLKDSQEWWLPILWSSQICSANFQFSSPPHKCFLLGTCSPCLSVNTNTGLNSGQLSVFLPGSQQHRLCSPSLNHLPHPLFFCTTEQPCSIWVVFGSSTSWGEELSREMSSLLWWGLGCEMTCGTSYSSSNTSAPSYRVEDILLFIFWIKLQAFLYGKSVP